MQKRTSKAPANKITINSGPRQFIPQKGKNDTKNIGIVVNSMGVNGITKNLSAKDIEGIPNDLIYEMAYGGSGVSYFDSIFWDEQKDKEKAYTDDSTRNLRIVEGEVKCPRTNCGYNRIRKQVKQLRSGDEGATVMFHCPRCGNTWSDSS